MSITDLHYRDGAAPRGFIRRFGWFVVIWAASTVAFISLATLLRLLVPH